jgi:hypothetical protein
LKNALKGLKKPAVAPTAPAPSSGNPMLAGLSSVKLKSASARPPVSKPSDPQAVLLTELHAQIARMNAGGSATTPDPASAPVPDPASAPADPASAPVPDPASATPVNDDDEKSDIKGLTKGDVKKIEEQIAMGKETYANMAEVGISEKKYKKYKVAKGTTTKDKALAVRSKIKAIIEKASSMPTYADMAKEGISERSYTEYKIENKLINIEKDKTQLFKTIDLLISLGKTSVSDIKQTAPGFKTNWMVSYRKHYKYKGKFTTANIADITARVAQHAAAAKKL